jgi:two-component system response regulator YesN
MFREFNGVSLNEYIADTRMNYAIELLGNANVKINNISQAAGYGSSNYFARLFKSKMKVTPTEYRMRLQRKDEVSI